MSEIIYESNIEFAQLLDQKDPLKSYRDSFLFPQRNGKNAIYFCGNSLGLQPKSVSEHVNYELKKWAENGVEGHFDSDPWVGHHKKGKKTMAMLVGAKEHEVVAMNNLTTNMHLMLASFYQPKGIRKKILIEAGAFPSDYFAITSHMEQKNVNPSDDLIEIIPNEAGYFSIDHISEVINEAGHELALVLLPGIQYYSGQFLNIGEIAACAHRVGAYVGFDLAHAAGNVPLTLHHDEVDFAVWCSYKYLNSGPGNVSGAFIHERHSKNTDFPRLAGWWGQDETIRFKMENKFQPMSGIDGWMLSNANIISSAAHLASLALFESADISQLREKSLLLTGYLYFLLTSNDNIQKKINILTPANETERGCQLSLFFHEKGRKIFDALTKEGVIMDWREPNVIRVAPTPMYNTFEEVKIFSDLLEHILIEG